MQGFSDNSVIIASSIGNQIAKNIEIAVVWLDIEIQIISSMTQFISTKSLSPIHRS